MAKRFWRNNLFSNQEKSTIIDQNIPNHYLKIIDQIENKNTVIKGLVAQKGKAKGVVRIVNSYHDIKKFVSGEILVANTTPARIYKRKRIITRTNISKTFKSS